MEASFARSILVDAPMAVVAVDAAGDIRTSNATADVFFGRALTQDPPLSIAALIEGFDVTDLASDMALARFNAKSRSAGEGVHMRAWTGEGAEAFVDIQAARFSARGEDFLTLFIQDVTGVVQAGIAIQELRLQITYNWRLNSLGEMASMVAHELNQPLSAILNFLNAAKALLDRPEIDRVKTEGFIQSAEVQAERASDVIRRLRSLMSHDRGFQAPENVAEVVAEILPILNINARELDAEILVAIAPDDTARCDRVQLQQVVINLVRNALDAPPAKGRRRVRVSGQQTETAYRLLVEDNGPGIDPGIESRLFEPLVSSKVGGMGLGLSICRTIAEAHSGGIERVESALGGAAFAVTLSHEVTS